MKRWVDNGVIVTLITAFLFIISTTYNNSYLSEFGINPELITYSLDRILYRSLIILFLPSLKILLIIFILILIIIVTREILRILNKKTHMNQIIQSDNNIENKENNDIEKFLFKSGSIIVFLLVVIFFLLYGLSHFETIAKDKSKELKKEIKSNLPKNKNLIHFTDTSQIIYLVTCGIENCAGIDIKSGEVIYFKKDNKIDTLLGIKIY